MAEIPTRTCRACGQTFPLDAAHFYRDRHAFRPICQACTRARLATLKAAAKARHAAERAARAAAWGTPPPKPKRHWVPNPSGKGLDPAWTRRPGDPPLFKRPPRDPAADFQAILLAEAAPWLDEMAQRVVQLALEGDMAMVKYLADRLLELGEADEGPLARALRTLEAERLAEYHARHDADPDAAPEG